MSAGSAAIVLAGGRSTRMGRPKAALEWHGSTLARRAVGIVARAVDGPVVLVHARDQELPRLPSWVELAQDAREACGPLEGIAAGLHALAGRAEIAFVCGVDAPHLHPALVRRVIAALGAHDDVALPHADGFDQPLAAAYRVATVAPLLRTALADAERLGTRALIERCRVRRLDARALLADPELAAHDPRLRSLASINDPAEYEAARAQPAPAVTIEGQGTVHAATLAALPHDGPVAVAGRALRDPEDPLVAGDVVVLQASTDDDSSTSP